MEVTYGPESFPWSEYDPADEGVRPLASLVLELRPRFSYNRAAACGRETVRLDAVAARALLSTTLQGFIVTQHERLLVSLLGRQYFVRVKEVETDVWQVTCSPEGRIVGPTVITYHGGDVFECVYRDGDVDRNFPHKLTYADGSVDTVTIPLGVADRGNTRLVVEMINKETREVDGWIVSYVYK
jgi:hypothetical protein